jgi:hypothetical protein
MTVLAQHPWIAIAVGAILVGLGGFCANWGWHQSSELKNRNNLIKAVVQEWQINDSMVKEALSLAQRWNIKGNEEKFSNRSYKSTRLNALISSGDLGDRHESLLVAAQKYESTIGDMEAALRIVGRLTPGIFIKVELIHNPPDEMPENENDLLSGVFLNVLEAHRELGVSLKSFK